MPTIDPDAVSAPTVIRVTDYGAIPDSGQDAVMAVKTAIGAAKAMDGPVVLEFPKGRYDFFPEHAAKLKYFISNTTTEDENPDVTKIIGLFFKGIRHLIVDGLGSLFIFHGKMTMIALDQCENVTLRNFRTDFERPTMSEITVEAVGSHYLDVRTHSDSWYVIEEGKVSWIGEGWKYSDGPAQEYDPLTNTTWRVANPVSMANKIEQLSPLQLRLHFDHTPVTKVGRVFQMRDGIRDQVGVFINQSLNITGTQLHIHYMHGLGIVGQFSENLTFDGLKLAPRPETGRTCAAFADFVHMSSVKGKVTIINSHFEGAHDDAINVHGTHLQIIEQPSPNQIVVRYMHGQTYGFDGFFPGDSIDFVHGHSLTVYANNTVKNSEMISLRELLLTLEQPIPEGIEAGDVVENISWTAEVEIRNNRFFRIPTRGILVTTRKKVVIADNHMKGIQMSGVLIADDAESWYESGIVNDVLIRNNNFIECGVPVINITPENKEMLVENPVHRHIRIEENEFYNQSLPLLYGKSTQGLHFLNNQVFGSYVGSNVANRSDDTNFVIHLEACSDVIVQGNHFLGVNKNNVRYMKHDLSIVPLD
ncbi:MULTISPECIES: right-handed parallel beta-helix repeat-containing protein [unclassified Paenibacillus]|uniref:right-handed parallel beta-helix repeat-containing protein n=1 Tax=unclassified Paenibacillus TaxID=185978 RepID=UPI00070F2AA3|nr:MULTISPECIES: right-handed parallel beta-helix repeat-containing protein [unclassified Paenibacillus]KQX68951.1 alpha-galactosidase [Paenibacillus sp. Root444D2]KRE47982.1 alpha-galactosidase [Paenibacillus sp. Soil724D2]